MTMKTSVPTRRRFLKTGAAASTLMIAGPAILRRAVAEQADLAPYKSAHIDWQQTSGGPPEHRLSARDGEPAEGRNRTGGAGGGPQGCDRPSARSQTGP